MATTVTLTSRTGIPVSTTHIAMGIGLRNKIAAIDINVVRDIELV